MRLQQWIFALNAIRVATAAFQGYSSKPARLSTGLSYSASTEVDFLKRIQRLTRERDGRIVPPLEEESGTKKQQTAKAVSSPSLLKENWLSTLIEGTTINVRPLEEIWDKFSFDPSPLASEGDWSAYWDQHGSGYIYFFNELTGESQWDPPTLSFPKIELKDGMKVVEKAIEDENDFSAPLASQGEWSAYFDGDKTNMVYYHNSLTGISQWEKPSNDFPCFILTPAMKKRMRRGKAEFVVADAFAEISKIAGSWLQRFETSRQSFSLLGDNVDEVLESKHKNQPTIFTAVADAFSRSALFGNAKAERKVETSWNFFEQCMNFFGKKD